MAKVYAPIKLSENIAETPEGFLLCSNVAIARTGWMDYGEGETPIEPGANGITRIYRDAEDVFDPITISSAEGKAFTIKHPVEFVTPDNWGMLAKGMARNVRRGKEADENGDEPLLADILVTDAFAIKMVRAGVRELSAGYDAEYEQTGEGEGRQRKIVFNHIALVEQGRAGPTYAINDEKGKATMPAKLIEKLKAKFGAKAVDEAMADDKAKDAKAAKATDEGAEKGKEEKAKDEGKASYDELCKMVKDLGEKIEALKPTAKDDMDASEDDEEASESDGEKKIEERIKALEAAVAKLLDMEAKENSEDESDEESEESEDESEESEDEESEESEDEESEEKAGKKEKANDSKGKKTGLEKTKNAQAFDNFDGGESEVVTAEKMNEINAAHWARK